MNPNVEICENLLAERAFAAPEVPNRRGSYLAFFVWEEFAPVSKRLNLHIDETGSQDLSEGVYMIAVVLHPHEDDIRPSIASYENRLEMAGLDDIPFHGKDLLHGNKDYERMAPGDRKRLLTQFARLVRSLPFSYFMLRYDAATTHGRTELEARMRRDLASFIFDHLSYFQSFESIAVYYDGGQRVVSSALHDALDFVLAKNVADYRDADYSARRLLQTADYICTVERARIAYDAGAPTSTQERFFGNRRRFYQSYVKQLARKRLT